MNAHVKHGQPILDKPDGDKQPCGSLTDQINAVLDAYYYGIQLNDDGTYHVPCYVFEELAASVGKLPKEAKAS